MTDPKDIYFNYSISIETGMSADGDTEQDLDEDVVEEIIEQIREELIKTRGKKEIYLTGEIVIKKDDL
jgi:hypothetical protein